VKQSAIAIAAFSLLTAGISLRAETLVLRPGAEGKDAVIWNRQDALAKNYGGNTEFHAGTWTWNADNLGTGTFRSLIEFDLKDLPASATLKSAKLFLKADTLGFTKGHSSLSASNAATLFRVKEAWSESTVTWNNQPALDTAGKIVLPQSANPKQNYFVDVTAMVAAMTSDSIGNHGFLLRSAAETPYNDMVFASGDHADSTLRPSLTVEYELQATGIAARTAQAPLRYRMAEGKLILAGIAAGVVMDLQGRIAARSGADGIVNLAGMKSGAYVLRSGARAATFVLP
jgi:hypothetical protein